MFLEEGSDPGLGVSVSSGGAWLRGVGDRGRDRLDGGRCSCPGSCLLGSLGVELGESLGVLGLKAGLLLLGLSFGEGAVVLVLVLSILLEEKISLVQIM